MYIYIFIYVYIHIYISICVYIYIYEYLYIYMYMYMYLYIYIYIFIYMYSYKYIIITVLKTALHLMTFEIASTQPLYVRAIARYVKKCMGLGTRSKESFPGKDLASVDVFRKPKNLSNIGNDKDEDAQDIEPDREGHIKELSELFDDVKIDDLIPSGHEREEVDAESLREKELLKDFEISESLYGKFWHVYIYVYIFNTYIYICIYI
jgi:hypothetical protein